MTTLTDKQAAAALKVVLTVGEAIRDLKRVPSGHLYARLMGHLSLNEYTTIIEMLKASGCIREERHELIWVEPAA